MTEGDLVIIGSMSLEQSGVEVRLCRRHPLRFLAFDCTVQDCNELRELLNLWYAGMPVPELAPSDE